MAASLASATTVLATGLSEKVAHPQSGANSTRSAPNTAMARRARAGSTLMGIAPGTLAYGRMLVKA
jgi:hypothetical protein